MVELFEKCVELLGEEKISIKDYMDILDSGFEEAKVGVLPPGYDRVTMGDIERTRLSHIKVLFFLGVNDGIIPQNGGRGGILSENDRRILKNAEVRLAPTEREKAYIQRFYLYLAMTKPEEKLYLSYCSLDSSGKSLRPSFLIGVMKKMFPDCVEESAEDGEGLHFFTPKSGLYRVCDGLRNYAAGEERKDLPELYHWYGEQESFRGLLDHMVKMAFYKNEEKTIGEEWALKLYGQDLSGSVSRFEQYAVCACSHFLKYGLCLKPREEFEFQGIDMGNVFHEALCLFSQKLKKEKREWQDLSEEEAKQFSEICLDEAIQKLSLRSLYATERNKYMIERMKRLLNRTVLTLSDHMKKGKFVQKGYEVVFPSPGGLEKKAVEMELEKGRKMLLRGKIDRIDTYETKDQYFVKIIDYKSGKKDFNLLEIYYGLDLQLVLYMGAALEMAEGEKNAKMKIPAGMFYYSIQDPMLEKKNGETKEEKEERVKKELKLKGLVNRDDGIVDYFDAAFTDSSTVIPVQKKKDGSFSARSNVVSTSDMKELIQYAQKRIADYGREILHGNVEALPYQMGDQTGCDYCEYRSVCGFDEKIEGFSYRRLPKEEKEELWNRIHEQTGKEEGGKKE